MLELPNGHKDSFNIDSIQHSTFNIIKKMNFPLFIAKRLYSEQGDKRKVLALLFILPQLV